MKVERGLFLGGLILLCACAKAPQPAAAVAIAPPPMRQQVLRNVRDPIAKIVTRDREVLVGNEGGVFKFDVLAKDGTVLFGGLDEAGLRRAEPEAFELVKSGTASQEQMLLDF